MGIVAVVLFPSLGIEDKRKLWSSTYHIRGWATGSQRRSQPCPALWILTNMQHAAASNCKNSDCVDWYWAKIGHRDPSFASELLCGCGQFISPLCASVSSPPLPFPAWSPWHVSSYFYRDTLPLFMQRLADTQPKTTFVQMLSTTTLSGRKLLWDILV